MLGKFMIEDFIYSINQSILVSVRIGGILGLTWLLILSRFSSSGHSYMLMLNMRSILYVVAQHFGRTDALTTLFFGLMLGNEKYIFKVFKEFNKRKFEVISLKRFSMEKSVLLFAFSFFCSNLFYSFSYFSWFWLAVLAEKFNVIFIHGLEILKSLMYKVTLTMLFKL